MRTVTLYDGRQVDSDSMEYLHECEATAILSMPMPRREAFFQDIERKRGAQALQALKRRCFETEPYYVLNLPNKPQRTHYLEQVEQRFGPNPRKTLESKILALHHARVASESGETA